MKRASASIHGSASTTGACACAAATARASASASAASICPSIRQTIERRVLVEAAHLDRPFDRLAVAAERETAVRLARDRDDAAIDLRRERLVDLKLGLARGLALRGGRIVEKRKLDRALDLVDALAGEEHRGRMGVDPPHLRAAMGRGIAQQREHLVLRLGLMHAFRSIRAVRP